MIGKQEHRQMDPIVLSRLCRQPSAVAAICVGVQSGQLSATGRAAPSGATLDADDVAGETDQDRSQGLAPCAAGDLPDGGGGGFAGIVPNYSGKDWVAAVTPTVDGLMPAGRQMRKGKKCWRRRFVCVWWKIGAERDGAQKPSPRESTYWSWSRKKA